MTDEAPAPDELLNIIRYNSKSTSTNPEGGRQYSYRANGLKCVAACGECRGIDCQNTNEIEDTKEDAESGDDFENVFESIFGM